MTRAPDPAADSATPAPRGTAALLADRTFGPWFWGNLASNSGNWLYNVTAAVVVFELTGSAFLVGLVSVAQFATLTLLSPWAGALTDRVDRRRLLIASQTVSLASAGALAAVTVAVGVDGLPGAWPVIAATFGIGVGVAVTGPALQALTPALVDDADLESAVALTSMTFNVGRALGPGVAGVIFVTLGFEAAFVINALTFLVLLAALAVIRPRARDRGDADGGDRSVRAGLRHVRRDPVLLWLLAGIAAIGFATDPINTLAAPLAAAIGGGETLVAYLVSAFGIGAAGTALIASRLQRRRGRLATAGEGAWLLAGGLGIAAVAPGAAVALAAFAVMGSGFLLGLTSLTAVLQRRVPEALRGRIMALWAVAFLGNRPVAAVIDGTIADLAGVRAAMIVPAAVAVAGALVSWRLRCRRAEPGPEDAGDAGGASEADPERLP